MKLAALLTALCMPMMAPAAFDSAQAPAGEILKILRITPSGEDVPSARQIVLEFDRPVVPVGRMARDPAEIPIAISPKLDCQWRWLNTNSLACQLGEKAAMQPATRYRVQVQPKMETEKGERLAERIEHSFITQRPDIQYIAFHTWQAPAMPVLRVVFNQKVTQASVQAHIYFRTEDQTRVPAVVGNDDTTPKYPALLPLPGEKAALRVDDPAPGKEATKPLARNSWLVRPAKELPLNSSVQLELEPGLQSELGPEASIQKRTALSLDTFPEFRFLGIYCLSQADDQWDPDSLR